eukprot:CAMPEP_0182539958 /NCGR_PEP_ID=MMETSP1323-20130603/26266_1 /TAXON_ID=236787 /ORGANISM="Florenciella parvula, Strain RCC1693" /LENGTH=194 /DNA_ID=CAMNT_0024750571 /DNA_START=13 /DNA_END=597 /DNA_ORIENTATION=+
MASSCACTELRPRVRCRARPALHERVPLARSVDAEVVVEEGDLEVRHRRRRFAEYREDDFGEERARHREGQPPAPSARQRDAKELAQAGLRAEEPEPHACRRQRRRLDEHTQLLHYGHLSCRSVRCEVDHVRHGALDGVHHVRDGRLAARRVRRERRVRRSRKRKLPAAIQWAQPALFSAQKLGSVRSRVAKGL